MVTDNEAHSQAEKAVMGNLRANTTSQQGRIRIAVGILAGLDRIRANRQERESGAHSGRRPVLRTAYLAAGLVVAQLARTEGGGGDPCNRSDQVGRTLRAVPLAVGHADVRRDSHPPGNGPKEGAAPVHRGEEHLRHDAAQSLCALLMLLGIIQRDPLGSETVKHLEQIRAEAEWLKTLVVRAGNVSRSVNVGDVVADTWSHVAACACCGVRLLRDPELYADVDVTGLRRTVRNLLENAVRAAGSTGRVEVRALADGEGILLEVADSGPGFGAIPTHHGLGLETVRRFVASHDGAMQCGTSDLGGALVRLWLPRAVRPAEVKAGIA